jgi:hypothetical protein
MENLWKVIEAKWNINLCRFVHERVYRDSLESDTVASSL